MTTPAERELARQVARLDREAKRQVDVALVQCAQHGPQYACVNSKPRKPWSWAEPRIGCCHIACRQILAGHCPECETP